MNKPIPVNMLDLQFYGDVAVGYYFEWVDADGQVCCHSKKPPVKPDFRVVCPKRWSECLVNDLCCLCGKKLDYWKWLVSDEPTSDRRVYPDPAMHYDCAMYAISVCPFLLGQRDHRRDRMPTGSENAFDKFNLRKGEQPKEIKPIFYLIKVREQWPNVTGQSETFCKKNRAAICEDVQEGRVPMGVCCSKAVASEQFDRSAPK